MYATLISITMKPSTETRIPIGGYRLKKMLKYITEVTEESHQSAIPLNTHEPRAKRAENRGPGRAAS